MPNTPSAPAKDEDWLRPVELAEAYGPAFPVTALSAWHQRFVAELADQVQIAPDAAALGSIAMIGAAAAKTVVVRVQPGDEHPLNFWGLVVSAPGDGKTPLMDELRRPFDQVEVQQREASRAEAARAATERQIVQLELRRLEGQAARSEDSDERQDLTARAVELRKTLEQRRPGLPTLTTGDCTPLGLIGLLARNRGRLALLTDEGDQLFSKILQRSKSGAEDIADMLKSYSGAPIDRHDAHREYRVPGAALSIVAFTQPQPFAKVMGVQAFHGKGFLGRFAIVLPRSLMGARKQRRPDLSTEAKSAYHGLMRRLLDQPIPETPLVLTLTDAAFDIFAERATAADRELVTATDPNFRWWLGKLRGLIARLAGILHLAEPAHWGVSVISAETMARAVEIGAYLAAHARVAYEHSEQAALDEEPRRLLRWIRDGRRERFSHAEAVTSFSGRLRSNEIDRCLQRLVAANLLREQPGGRSRTGRPRKPSYLVNPYVFRID
jgi:hypothetical protein